MAKVLGIRVKKRIGLGLLAHHLLAPSILCFVV